MSNAAERVILDPRAGPAAVIEPYVLSLDPHRPGLRIALVSNGFYDATALLNAVGEALATQLASPRLTVFARRDPSVAAPLEAIEDIARTSDVAITALGHCGSCTASATRDAIHLARAGIPVCALISEKFQQTAGFVARAAGMPDVPRVILPHPVAGTGPTRIAHIAHEAIGGILARWESAPRVAAA